MTTSLFLAALALGVFPSVLSESSSSSSYSSYSFDVFQMRPCAYNGKFYMHGQTWEPLPCASCTCRNLISYCTIDTCPACDGSLTEPVGDQCCGTCDGETVEPNEEDFCVWRGVTYQNGDSFTLNPCTDCTCEAGKGKCEVRSCGPAECDDPVEVEGECCLVCP
ncbi:putative cysteine-rich motor neuron 1 protein [Apostichopus japonicus]|uniref:Putative cysteine-rich motor neuron 1 protein n=1 Tax=Stichopus japonicus TaxID=307972 RepID=A0A2G8KTC7_STIJA|nr:putative cysteine-rich motor neuron 1 protein [Apostichopus japonicus]